MLLAGCASKKIDLVATPVTKPVLVLPEADVLTLKKVEWTLITEKNSGKAFADLKKKGRPLVFFGTTDDGYEALATNLSSIRAYIQQQQEIINAYERYYFDSTRTIDTANEEINGVNRKIKDVNEGRNEPSIWDKLKKKFTNKVDDLD